METEVVKDAFDWFLLLKDFVIAFVAFGTAIATLKTWIMKPIKKQQEADEEQNRKIDELSKVVKSIDGNCADLMWDRLASLHDHHCNILGWCSAQEKRRIVELYNQYHGRGYNHLADTYVQDIMGLPEKKQK